MPRTRLPLDQVQVVHFLREAGLSILLPTIGAFVMICELVVVIVRKDFWSIVTTRARSFC